MFPKLPLMVEEKAEVLPKPPLMLAVEEAGVFPKPALPVQDGGGCLDTAERGEKKADRDAAPAPAPAAATVAAEVGSRFVDHGDIAVARPTRLILLLPGDSEGGGELAAKLEEDDAAVPKTNPPAGAPCDGAGLSDRCGGKGSQRESNRTGQRGRSGDSKTKHNQRQVREEERLHFFNFNF